MRIFLAITKSKFDTMKFELHMATEKHTNMGDRNPDWVEVKATVEELNKLVRATNAVGGWACWCSDPESYEKE